MAEDEQSSSSSNNMLNTPLAIVIAGGLIALALYFSNGGSATTATTKTDTDTDTAPAAGTAAKPNQPAAAGPTIGDFRPVSDEDHIRGAANAKVTIIEYSDLECPFCQRFHVTMTQVLEKYPNDVRWVYRHFPLTQLHSKADTEAYAAECAGEQGKFWEFTDLVFEVTPSNNGLDLDTLPDLARQAGVANITQFQTCLDSEKYADKVAADLADAGAAGGRGTPYSIVIGPDGETTAINGAQPFESVSATVESLL